MDQQDLTTATRQSRWFEKTPEQRAAQSAKAQAWQKANPEKRKMYADRHKESHLSYGRRRHIKQRLESIKLLGDACMHCNNVDIRVLQIDHIKGDGYLERTSSCGRSGSFYTNLLKDPEAFSKYQLLCANCHVIKTIENKDHLPRDTRPEKPLDA